MPATATQPAPTTTATDQVPALERTYRAEYESGGKVRVKDTPFFAEVTERAGEPQPFNAEWLAKALERDQALRASGYHAPMHFGHQGRDGERERAGYFELNRVEKRLVEGQPKMVLIGDRVYDTVDKFEKAKRGCPYISVEVSPDKPDEVNSAALLSSAAPFHRFPDFSVFSAAPGQPATYLWRTDMAEQAPPKPAEKAPPAKTEDAAPAEGKAEAPPFAKKDEAAPPAAAAEGTAEAVPAGAAPAAPAAQPAQDAGSLQTLVSGMQDIKTIVMSLSAIVAKLAEAGLGGFAGGLGGLGGKMPSAGGAGTIVPAIAAQATAAASPAPVVTFTAAPVQSAVGQPQAATQTTDHNRAQLEGELSALKMRLAELEKKGTEEQTFSSLHARLRTRFAAGFEDELRRRVKDGSAQGWVEGLERASAPLPQAAPLTGEPAPQAPLTGDAAEVTAYAAKGKIAEARQAAQLFAAVGPKHYLRCKRDNNGNDAGERTLKEFLEIQVGE